MFKMATEECKQRRKSKMATNNLENGGKSVPQSFQKNFHGIE